MTLKPLRVLLIEDSESDAKLLTHALRRGYPSAEVERVDQEPTLRAALARGPWDAIISDWSMPQLTTLRALAILRELELDLPFIIASGTIGESAAVEAMRAGAHDYLLKDQLARLLPAVEREIRECKVREAHRRQEARFRALIEKSAEGIVISSPPGPWVYMSPTAAKIFGYPYEELVGRRIADFVHPEDRALIAQLGHDLRAAAGATIAVEFRTIQKSGAVRWVASTSTNLVDDPAINGVVSNVRDITARKLAEEALRISEARFAHLAESGIIGVLTADLATGQILDANDTFLKLTGHSRAELASGTVLWAEVVAPDHLEAASRFATQVREAGVTPAFETALIHKNGARVPMLVGAAMLDATRAVAFCADLTEKKSAEAALEISEAHLRQAQKMEAIGRLAGGVAHDFNNIVSVILSYSEVLLSDLDVGDPRRDDVEEIRKAGQRAADLTRQLLMFSRQQVLAPKILDLDDLLGGMAKMLERLVGEDVELAFVRAPSLGKIKADPSSIEQVIMNLVVNARDAMPNGGRLSLETSNVVLDQQHGAAHGCMRSGPHVLLRVSDTGVGIDPATQLRIFEPFFTTKPKDKGTGLGLSTVFGIVAQSTGCVSVESEIGKGTTFRIFLPCQEGTAQVVAEVTTSVDDRGTETILLVEDDDQVRTVVRGILQRHGYTVIVARNAGEALLSCEQRTEEIHLLLSDIVMPQMSGPELSRRLASMRPQMKILFMSGYTDDNITRHGVMSSSLAFLQKPFTPASLARKVRSVLDAARLPTAEN